MTSEDGDDAPNANEASYPRDSIGVNLSRYLWRNNSKGNVFDVSESVIEHMLSCLYSVFYSMLYMLSILYTCMIHLLDLLFTLIPAMMANMTPVVLARLKVFETVAKPVDGRLLIHGQPLFGAHKTWRGLVGGVIVGLFTAFVLLMLHNTMRLSSLGLFSEDEYVYRSFLMSVGAMVGDLMESFAKRRLSIDPGNVWFPYDFVDYPLGAILFSGLFVRCTLTDVLLLVILAAIVTPLFNSLMQRWGIKQAV